MQHAGAEDEYEDDLEHEDGDEGEPPSGEGKPETIKPVEGDQSDALVTERSETNEEGAGGHIDRNPAGVGASDGVASGEEAKGGLAEAEGDLVVDTNGIAADGPQSGVWATAGASTMASQGSPTSRALLLEFLEGVEPEQPSPSPRGAVGEKERTLREATKDPQIAVLTRKLKQSRKLNSELQRQLHEFYINEPIAQLENRVRERELRIDELLQENRLLKHTERLLTKEIEEFQSSKDNFPLKKQALQEELRVCKERIRHLKEQQKAAEERSSKLHKQAVDLAVKNKELNEKLRQLEGPTGSPPRPLVTNSPLRSPTGGTSIDVMPIEEVQAVLASQEESITRLQQRVTLMKKAHKAERAKFERLLKISQDEIERSRTNMEAFHQQLFAKERTARSQFLLMKKLKRTVQELSLTHQSNQHFQRFLAGRDMRMAQRNGNISHHNGGTLQHSLSDSIPSRNRGQRIHDTLCHLGFVMPLASGQDAPAQSPGDAGHGDQADVPSNCVRGMLMPVPPSSMPAKGLSDGASNARTQFYSVAATSRPSSGSKNTHPVDNDSHESEGNENDSRSSPKGDNDESSADDTRVCQEPDTSKQSDRFTMSSNEDKSGDQSAVEAAAEETIDSEDQSAVDNASEKPANDSFDRPYEQVDRDKEKL